MPFSLAMLIRQSLAFLSICPFFAKSLSSFCEFVPAPALGVEGGKRNGAGDWF